MQSTSYVLGVDVHKDTLAVCLMDRPSHTVLSEDSISNDDAGVKRFISRIPKDTLASLTVAVEPTNNYWYRIADAALVSECKVVPTPPGPAKLFLRSLNPRAKVDRLDARGIALYACCMDLSEYTPKPECIRQVEELLSLRRKISENIAYYKQVASSRTAGADVAASMLSASQAELHQLDLRLKQTVKQLEPASRLMGVPGFGPVTSLALASSLMYIPFKKSDAFVAYVGLDLKVHESGKFKGRRMLSHRGDSELRRLLYLAAQSTIRVKGSPFAQIYQRHLGRGLTKTESICVVARKLARTAWSIVRFPISIHKVFLCTSHEDPSASAFRSSRKSAL